MRHPDFYRFIEVDKFIHYVRRRELNRFIRVDDFIHYEKGRTVDNFSHLEIDKYNTLCLLYIGKGEIKILRRFGTRYIECTFGEKIRDFFATTISIYNERRVSNPLIEFFLRSPRSHNSIDDVAQDVKKY